MDKNFIELLTWIIALEITKDQQSKGVDHQNIFRKICDSLSKEYNISFNHDDPFSESRIKLGKKMINFYNDHFMETSDDERGDGKKLIEFPIMTGKYYNEFRELNMIGGGAFGKVYRALNLLDHKDYAIKKVGLYGTRYSLNIFN